MVGLLAAVQRYISLDHEGRADWCEQTVEQWNEALNSLQGVNACRDFPNEAGQPLPRSLITISEDESESIAMKFSRNWRRAYQALLRLLRGRNPYT